MKTRNAFANLTICVLLALTTAFFVNLDKAFAQPITDCRKNVAGTYLTTTNSGDFGSLRGIATYTQDGDVFFSSSNQSGTPSIPPSSIVHGIFKCISEREITTATLNFFYPTATSPGLISRSDGRATFDPKAGTVQATVTLRTFDLKADPLNDDAPVTGTFTYTGQRIKTGL